MRKFSLSLLIVSALAGCSLAPEYHRPEAPVAAAWPASAEGARAVAQLDWRQLFPDARLQALIAAALDHNRDLRMAVARVAEARALYGIQRADRLPSINLGADRIASHVPADLSSSGSKLTTQRFDANLGITVFELDFWGRVRNLSEAALASYLATEDARQAFRLSLIADVANAYLGSLELEERVTLARETLRTRKETRELVALRREVGLAGDLDFLQADGAAEAVRADLAALERQRAAADSALRLLVGTWPDTLPPARPLAEQGIVADLAAGLPSEALLRRPDVQAAEQRLIAANANIGAARAAFLPRITLTGAYGTASKALSGLFKGDSEAWTFQPVLSLPLFDFGRTSSNVDLAEARKVIAVADYEKTLQQAFKEVADLLVARDTLAEQLKALEATEKAQRERLRLADARYRGGIASHLELLDAQRDLFTAQQATVQTRRSLLATAAQLYKALGGGDSENAAETGKAAEKTVEKAA